MHARILVCLLGLLLPLTGLCAEDDWAPAKRIDAWFDELAKSQKVNGSIAISENGKLRYRRSVGFARIENGVPQPADAGTRYRIGPVSRMFTAVLALQLAEKATIGLDVPVAEFFPDLPNALNITYRDLLRERSGLADYMNAADFASWHAQPRSRAQMLDAITAGGKEFPPGERVEHSSSNYLILGYVLEKVQGRSYDDLLGLGVAKAGLARTYFAGTRPKSLESVAYRPTPQGWVEIPASDPSVLGGAAGVISNPADLVQFMDAVLSGRQYGAQILATLRGEDGIPPAMFLPHESEGVKGFGLQGTQDGFTAAVYHFPAPKITIAWTGNATSVPPEVILEKTLATIVRRVYAPSLTS